MNQLSVAFRLAPWLIKPRFDQWRIGRQKCPPDILGKRKVFLPIAGAVIIIENAAHTARALAVGNIEIFVRPSLVARIDICPMRRAIGI